MNPYKDLYIYEIEGVIDQSHSTFREDFLGCWCEGDCSYIFFSTDKKEVLKTYLADDPSLSLRSETVVDYKDWEAGAELRPFKAGRLHVSPVWETVETGEDEVLISIDPRLAFGSGNHATTKQCLEALCLVYQDDQPKRVLDLGCGTGILAVAAAKLGGERVLAVDYSNLAVETAERNCQINHVENRVEVVEGEALDHLGWESELLLANLRYYIIEELMESPHFVEKKWYILSGLLWSETQQLLKRLPDFSINVVKIISGDSWSTVVAKRD
jgi:ribosomal protein L11 methyltransferase